MGQREYTCPVTKKTVRMPCSSTASPYCLMECSPDDNVYPECSECDFSHRYTRWIPPVSVGGGVGREVRT